MPTGTRGRALPVTAPRLRPLRVPVVLFVLQRVTAPGRYLNHPSALIRHPGERRGRRAEREPSRSSSVPGGGSRSGADACLRRGEEEEGGEGIPLLLRCPPEGCPWVRLCRAGFTLTESGWQRRDGRLAEGSTGLTRTHPDPACAPSSSPLLSSGSAKAVPFPNPAWKTGPSGALTPSPSILTP